MESRKIEGSRSVGRYITQLISSTGPDPCLIHLTNFDGPLGRDDVNDAAVTGFRHGVPITPQNSRVLNRTASDVERNAGDAKDQRQCPQSMKRPSEEAFHQRAFYF